MILDDDPLVLEVVASGLKDAGADAICAQDVPEASQFWQAGGVDAVVLDLNLDKGTSLGFAASLREKAPAIPVFALTAQDMDSLSGEEQRVFNEVLPKWTPSEELVELLARALNKDRPF